MATILKPREVQAKLKISYPTLRRFMACGLPYFQPSAHSKILFTEESINAWIEKNIKSKKVKGLN
jgi:predicted site-specific integrase-resolvase